MTMSSVFLLLLCASTTLATGSTAFRLQLHHVDAKANTTMAERLSCAVVRTHRRLASSSDVSKTIKSDGRWDYIVEYAIGDPPQAV